MKQLRGAVDLSGLARRAAQPAPPAEASSAGGSGVVRVDDASAGALVQESTQVPVILVLGGESAPTLVTTIERIVAGRIRVAVAGAAEAPGLFETLGVRGVPTTIALIAGRPLPLFSGVQPDAVLEQMVGEILRVAAEHGVTGTLATGEADGDTAEPAAPPLPPLHQEAQDALERGDYAAATAAYRTAVAQNPRDEVAARELERCELVQRLATDPADPATLQARVTADVTDLDAHLALADHELTQGAADQAFGRLLDRFPHLDADGKTRVRARLLNLFAVLGPDDPVVQAARRRLSSLLY